MPDIISIISRRGKLVFGLTFIVTVLALVISLLRPKDYLATVTALPANSAIADKARMFNPNIESLYPEIGSPDELDRIEGTAKLDTIYLAVADSLKLLLHYKIDKSSPDATNKTAARLKSNTDIRRSAYGELKIKVWDGSPAMAAQIANALLNKLNEIHQHIQSSNNAQVLKKLREEIINKQVQIDSIETGIMRFQKRNVVYDTSTGTLKNLTGVNNASDLNSKKIIPAASRISFLNDQINEYHRIISQCELAIATNPKVLIAVENARPPISPDNPKILQTVFVTFFASLIFSFFLALFAEGHKENV